jgi:hypothetical protein
MHTTDAAEKRAIIKRIINSNTVFIIAQTIINSNTIQVNTMFELISFIIAGFSAALCTSK